MNACELTASITAITNWLACQLTQEHLLQIKEAVPKRRVRIGIYTLQNGSFPAILRQKATAGVSLAVAFYLVLRKNLSFWSASQF